MSCKRRKHAKLYYLRVRYYVNNIRLLHKYVESGERETERETILPILYFKRLIYDHEQILCCLYFVTGKYNSLLINEFMYLLTN